MAGDTEVRPSDAATRTPGRGGDRSPRTRARREKIFAYGMLTPTLAVVGLLTAYPIYVAINLSFRGGEIADLQNLGRYPLTLANYVEVITDPELLADIWRSLVYTVGVLAPAFAIGLGLALLLNRTFPGRRIVRPLALLPWAVPGVVVSAAFSWMLDGSFGVINYLLRSVGLIEQNVAWLANSSTAMTAVIIPTVWKFYPFFTIVLVAALQAIPHDLYEAARIDGARSWQQFRHVTWPALRAPAALAIVITGVGVFREFDFIFPLTGGGPDNATRTLAVRIYNEAFEFFSFGVSAALGVVTMFIAGALLLAANRAIGQGVR
ncbi:MULTISPECIES: carbohydrate ABC transporter permease [Actinoalloteichus]|uniref:Permease component of ABC-type sugar transporter n=1 Tax=Actinoalloteichus fjordicus TaxID=1612552 RepID=A0AAC9LFI8_9PSEU|nr:MULTISPECIES: sugar ABC transporter permease [Actinoalloteichus]APU15930.1 permease component of ABC-type sugar transporter [Actinoalloteichus fjordicus]APU21992.1 permease component of ABC-type sugar transporter [Actinoalloteichus sp. GBA129-24]